MSKRFGRRARRGEGGWDPRAIPRLRIRTLLEIKSNSLSTPHVRMHAHTVAKRNSQSSPPLAIPQTTKTAHAAAYAPATVHAPARPNSHLWKYGTTNP